MAHFVRLNQLDHGHTSDDDEYTPLLINLDMVINIEPSPNNRTLKTEFNSSY